MDLETLVSKDRCVERQVTEAETLEDSPLQLHTRDLTFMAQHQLRWACLQDEFSQCCKQRPRVSRAGCRSPTSTTLLCPGHSSLTRSLSSLFPSGLCSNAPSREGGVRPGHAGEAGPPAPAPLPWLPPDPPTVHSVYCLFLPLEGQAPERTSLCVFIASAKASALQRRRHPMNVY